MSYVYIITGTTRGFGNALARRVMTNGDRLFSLSSAEDDAADQWYNLNCDMSDPTVVAATFERLIDSLLSMEARSLVLINNAGVLDPVGPIESSTEPQIIRHMTINHIAPAVLTAAFIRRTAGFASQRRIINISSGAARHPYAGWAMYCSAKAALEMMTRSVAAEQDAREDPVTVCAVRPGKVETRMQRSVRALRPDQFPAQPEFVAAKKRGDVRSPEAAAKVLLDADRAGLLQNGRIYDLRDAVYRDGSVSITPVIDK